MTMDGDKRQVELVCPSPEELSVSVNNHIPCPVTGCDKVMKNVPSFKFHLAKTHSIVQDADDLKYMNHKYKRYTPEKSRNDGIERRYHCPGPGCPYLKNSKRFFSTYHLLRQHYLKIHADKTFHCSKCDARYSTQRDLNQHAKECGLTYRCLQCQGVFQKRQSWVNHCRRLNHPRTSDEIATAATLPYEEENVTIKPLPGADLREGRPAVVRLLKNSNESKLKAKLETVIPSSTSSNCADKNQPSSVKNNQENTKHNSELTKGIKAEPNASRSSNPKGSQTNVCSSTAFELNSVGVYKGVSTLKPPVSEQSCLQSISAASTSQSVMPVNWLSSQMKAVDSDHTIRQSEIISSPQIDIANRVITTDRKEAASAFEKLSCKPILPKTGYLVIPCVLSTSTSVKDNMLNAKTMNPTQGADLFRHPVSKSCQSRSLIPIAPKQTLTESPSSGYNHKLFGSTVVASQSSPKRSTKKPAASRQKHAVTTQTTTLKKRRAVAETQTSGDFILQQAMQSANLPTESRGSQVSPRAKLKPAYQEVKTTQTQTQMSPRQPARKRTKTQSVSYDSSTITDSTSSNFTDSYTVLEIPEQDDNRGVMTWGGGLSDSQTQTMALLRDLEATFAESAATQTRDSFLSQDSAVICTSVTDTSQTENTPQSFKHTEQNTTTSSIAMTSARNIDTPTFDIIEAKSTGHAALDEPIFMPVEPVATATNSAGVETQTQADFPDFPDLLSSHNTQMNMETQTSMDDMFHQLLTDMHTQTSSDTDLFAHLPSSHIETQTPFDPLFSNVETQTGSQQDFIMDGGFLMDMETQTVGSFGFPLSTDLADSHTQTTWDNLETLVSSLQESQTSP